MEIESNNCADINNIIKSWIINLEASGKSKATIEAYKREIDRLAGFTGTIKAEDITKDIINQFILSDNINCTQNGTQRSEVTISRAKAVLKSFGSFLEEQGLTAVNIAQHIKIKRACNSEPLFPTPEERKRLIKAVSLRKGDAAERDLVILKLFLGTGIRLSELAGLNISDINLDEKKIIITAKGGKKETRFINTKLRTTLKTYLRKRRDMITDSQAVFLSNRGTRITTRQIDRRFTHWLKWSGITRKLTVHSLRHHFATNLYKRTKNLVLVSKALGHRHISTTQIYTHLFDHELEDAIEDLS